MINKIKVFIDSNIPMYAIGKTHWHKDTALKILKDAEKGEVFAVSSCEVFREILHRYKKIGKLQIGLKLFDSFYEIIDEVLPINFEIIKSARLILGKNYNIGISLKGCIHYSTMLYYGINYLASFDKHFKNFRGVNYYKA